MRKVIVFLALTAILAASMTADATHGYDDGHHWKVTTVKFIESVTEEWDQAVIDAFNDYQNGIDNLELQLVHGKSSKKIRKSCPAPKNAIRICNFNYLPFSFMGQAAVHVKDGHTKYGTIKLNDGKEPPKRPDVCHEMGHTLGLDHRPQADMNSSCMTTVLFNNLPDQHDFDVIDAVHNHLHVVLP